MTDHSNTSPESINTSLPRTAGRLESIDALRGLVMVFMCLDHTREFFGDLRLNPEDLQTTKPLMFFTRWITHFCAPTFVFLAGVSAWMYGQKAGRDQLSRFLFTRGAWLVFLEFSVVHFAWLHSFDNYPFMFIIIAAIGVCMMTLAGLIFVPYCWLVGLGLGIVIFHNLLDPLLADNLGSFSNVWKLLHDGGYIPELGVNIGYPILPWIGVIVCGYVFGPILQQERPTRIRNCLWIGAVCTLSFLCLRFTNGYGDPVPWTEQSNSTFTFLSFLSCSKYPPSLLYLLMTLGPALMMLAVFDGWHDAQPPTSDDSAAANGKRTRNILRNPLLIFGRVPLFFYVVHLYLIHGLSRLFYWLVRGKPISSLQTAFGGFEDNVDIYGFGLDVVYIAWVVMLAILFPLCRWFGQKKRKGRSAIWSYL